MGVPGSCYETGMTKNAAAILHIAPTLVRDALAPAEGDDVRVGANGEHVRIAALGDATIVHLGIGIGAEPEELADRLDALLGDLLDQHEEPRGVPVYPSSYELEAQSWEAAIEELGEAADWVRLDEEPAGGMAELLGAFGLSAEQLESMEGAMGALPEGDRDKLFSSALRMAEELSKSGALEELAKRMHVFGAKDGEDQWKALERKETGKERWSGLGFDVDALADQARAMLAADPELEERLRNAIEGADEEDDAEDATVETDALELAEPEKGSDE